MIKEYSLSVQRSASLIFAQKVINCYYPPWRIVSNLENSTGTVSLVACLASTILSNFTKSNKELNR